MNKIKVMIVEDSRVVRELLVHIVGSDPRLEVAAAVASAEEALALLDTVRPDVISLDIRLPGMNGLAFTLQVMSSRPTPIVVVAANVDDDELNITMNALRAGALSVVEKPVGVTNAAFEAVANRLTTQLAIMSGVKVIRQGIDRGLRFGTGEPAPRQSSRQSFAMVGIVASTGGPQALVQLLGALGPDFPLPLLLVQHITASFLDGFVSWLSGVTPFAAAIATDDEQPQPGRIYLPPADRHLGLDGGRMAILATPPVSSQRPSGTVLLTSMAKQLGRGGIGVILTGMGTDGAAGMAEMRRAGGYTIGEDESTCTVFGMPAAAMQLGAANEMLPLPDIAVRLRQLATGGGR